MVFILEQQTTLKQMILHQNGFFSKYFARIAACIKHIDVDQLMYAAQKIDETKTHGGKIILIGNGGSAAMASHVSIDFNKVANVRAVNFNESALITCLANDYGYEHWVEKALEFHADPSDSVVLISSSGESDNIINAALKVKKMGVPLITFSGFKDNNRLRKLGDINFWADSEEYNVVEMTHHVWLVSLVDRLAKDNGANT